MCRLAPNWIFLVATFRPPVKPSLLLEQTEEETKSKLAQKMAAIIAAEVSCYKMASMLSEYQFIF